MLVSELWRIFRFGLVGLMATAVHLLVAALLLAWWPALGVFAINLLAYLTAFACSYLGHRHFTFNRAANPLQFMLVSLAGLGVNNLTLYLALHLGLEGLSAITAGVVVAAAFTYCLSRCWVFR